MDNWTLKHLVCPADKLELSLNNESLVCAEGHKFPVVSGVPILLTGDAESTHDYIEKTLAAVALIQKGEKGLEDREGSNENGIDEFVQAEIPYTSGILYLPVQNKLTRYPIPEIRIPPGSGERLLDIGCNWGRWSIAAARKGYKVVGIDPSLEAVLAAKRVSVQLGVEADFVVGDARFQPFANNSFDLVYSYGVFQHFSKENAKTSLREISRVLKKGRKAYVQMPNRFGARQFYQHWKRGFTEGESFEVRYWTPSELLKCFRETFGKTEISADCYFGLGIQKSDVDLLPLPYKAVVYSSELLRKTSGLFPPLTKVADSVFLESVNQNRES